MRNRNVKTRQILMGSAWMAAASMTASVYGQTEFVVSTSGATALGAFTRMNSNATSPTLGTINRGPIALGIDGLVIGNTTYNLQPVISYIGYGNPSAPITGEPTVGSDTLVYWYRESGSIQGILDLVDSNGLRSANPTPIAPGDPAGNLFLWANGSRFNSVASGYSDAPTNTIPNTIAGTPNTGRLNGRNYTVGVGSVPEVNQNGQQLVRIAWSDVRFEQGFAVSGASSFSATPTTTGYGLGRGSIGGTNYQALRNSAAIVGGTDASTTRLRNEAIAVVPFNLVANPGTGLAELDKEQAAWMQMVGRLPNGANFNSTTREIGSGTRNQGALNLGVDPSWAGGERDRRATAEYNSFDNDGNAIIVRVGDEANPVLSLTGSTVQDINENRIGPSVRFSDKISGSSGVRATVTVSRMGMGILSAGDSATNTATGGTALANVASTTAVPMRALRIDWDNDGTKTGTQARAANVIDGSYEMWSSSQAITVAPYANPTANDTGGNAYKPINGDLNDQSPGDPTSNAQEGIHRKFLNNITQPISSYNTTSFTSITPADFILTSSFIPPQIMAKTKVFDGGAYSDRTRSMDEEALYQQSVVNGSGVLNIATNWADPGTMNGGIGTGAVKYRIFASANNASNAVANRTIDVNARTNLAGDFNGDEVRDVQDVSAMALAYASPSRFLTTPASGDVDGFNYNGAAVNSTSAGTNASSADGLIVLSDFNSNGNVAVDANNGSFATSTIERSDVRYFLYGATVDTSAYDVGADAAAKAKNRRENGVRFGELKKNAAIGSFNSSMDGFVGVVNNPNTGTFYTQGEVDNLKFNKFDVNGDNVVTRADAKLVDRNIGKNYTNLSDVLSTNDDLVAAEFQDDLTITHVLDGGTSDFKMIRDALGTASLLDGDATIDGVVDVRDLLNMANNWLGPADQWSDGDFDFNGFVDKADLTLMAQNWQGAAGSLSSALASVGLPTAIPEPASLSLIAASSMLFRRRRRA